MKKSLLWGIIVALIIAGIVILLLLNSIKVPHDKISYIASSEYDAYSFLQFDDTNQYEIVDNQTRIAEILNSIKSHDYDNKINTSKYEDKYDETFFKDKNLLIVVGEIQSKITKLTIGDNTINVKLKFAFPNYAQDGFWKFDVYFIQIDKNISNITLDRYCYSHDVNAL